MRFMLSVVPYTGIHAWLQSQLIRNRVFLTTVYEGTAGSHVRDVGNNTIGLVDDLLSLLVDQFPLTFDRITKRLTLMYCFLLIC